MKLFSRFVAVGCVLLCLSCDGLRLRKVDRELLSAAGGGDTNKLIALIATGANVNVKSFDGRKMTPLLWAVSQAHWDAACLLVENGADVNVADAGGLTVREYLEWGRGDPVAARCLALIDAKSTNNR